MDITAKKVIVVFKTHLDIGFTGLAEDVLRRYCDDFIPAAVELAFRVNTGAQKKFVWTVGSYLIRYYLEHAKPDACARLEQAIRAGFIRWHGLACTTHTELMDRRLLDYDLSISQALDRRFGVTTLAAKMTDVPGHTIGLVPALSDAGIEFLHIGVNASSRVPSVPSLFRWRFGGKEITVNYAAEYGNVTLLENGAALVFYHAHDNSAPPSPEELEHLYARLAAQYPQAHIEAGTLDEFAEEIRQVRDSLPVLEAEIGDTWIHGAASDPLKVSWYRRLLLLKEKWLAEGRLAQESPAYDTLMENLLLICEHTWGMDTKKFLLDFTNWEKKAFAEARKKDITSYALFSPQNQHIFQALLPELEDYKKVRGGQCSSYSLFESSHQEQRDYITRALGALPDALKKEAQASFSFSYPTLPDCAVPCRAYTPLQAGPCTVTVGACGELTHISFSANGQKREMSGAIGLLEYETFGGKEVDDCYFEYGRDLGENFHWAEPDFGKPGLRYHPEIQHRTCRPFPASIHVSGGQLYIRLIFPPEASEQYGCPREAMAVYRFTEGNIHLELFWKDKDALRSPEALWLGIRPEVENPSCWQMVKSGAALSPSNVVSNGNRQLHVVQDLSYTGADSRIHITPTDAPLVSLGGKKLYQPDNSMPELSQGFFFLLYNNRWGTNFKQWFEEDMRFAFDISLS